MKCRVLTGFIDKNTGQPYDHGSLYECEKARFDEINRQGNYLAVIEEKTAEKAAQKPTKATK